MNNKKENESGSSKEHVKDKRDTFRRMLSGTNFKKQDQVRVERKLYHQELLLEEAEFYTPPQTFRRRVKKFIRELGIDECLLNAIPIKRWLPRYKVKNYLIGDIVAGTTTAVMHIPQGMAYAILAEVPPITGMYMAFFPVLPYIILGTSPHISVGTFSVVCLMAGKVVLDYSQHQLPLKGENNTTGDTPSVLSEGLPKYAPLEVLAALSFTIGLLQLLMWILRMGCLATFLSEPLVSAFTIAASVQVLVTQLKDFFGLQIPKYKGEFITIYTMIALCKNIKKVNWGASLMSLITCLILVINNEFLKPWMSKRSPIPVPIELLVIVGGTLSVKYMNLQTKYNLPLVGSIPTGLPPPKLPPFNMIPHLTLDAFSIMMVSYSVTMSLELIFANKEKYEVKANQELLALGVCNMFGSFFSCGPICGSLSRSYVQYLTGAKTAITLAISAFLILFVLLFIGPFFEHLPRCVLASIIVIALKTMFMQVKELVKFWKLSRLDGAVWILTFVSTALVAIDIGLLTGLLASVCTLFLRSHRPYYCLLGRVPHTELYLDIKRYRAAQELPGIKIFHYCGGLNFATKHLFRETLLRKIGFMKPVEKVEKREVDDRRRPSGNVDDDAGADAVDVKLHNDSLFVFNPYVHQSVNVVVIDATALSYVDAPGIRTLIAVTTDLRESKIEVYLAGPNIPVIEMVKNFNAQESDQLIMDTFPTVHDAVTYYKLGLKRASQQKEQLGVILEPEEEESKV